MNAHSRTLTASEIEEVRRFVRDHIAQAIQVDDLAATVGMSNSCFARIFRNATGRTPYRFILEERVQVATGLLIRRPGLSLGEVAMRCGFADQSHMTRVFRRIAGQTPARIRAAR